MATSSVTNLILNSDDFPPLSTYTGRITLDYVDTPRTAKPLEKPKKTTVLSLVTSPSLNQTLTKPLPPSTPTGPQPGIPSHPDICVRLPGCKKKKFMPLVCPTCGKEKYDHVTWCITGNKDWCRCRTATTTPSAQPLPTYANVARRNSPPKKDIKLFPLAPDFFPDLTTDQRCRLLATRIEDLLQEFRKNVRRPRAVRPKQRPPMSLPSAPSSAPRPDSPSDHPRCHSRQRAHTPLKLNVLNDI